MSLSNATLPVDALRKKLKTLDKRGYRIGLAEKSGVNTATIHRITFGPQKSVTYENWMKLYNGDPQNIPSPDAVLDDIGDRYQLDEDEEIIIKIYRKLDDKKKKRLVRDVHRLILSQMDEENDDD